MDAPRLCNQFDVQNGIEIKDSRPAHGNPVGFARVTDALLVCNSRTQVELAYAVEGTNYGNIITAIED